MPQITANKDTKLKAKPIDSSQLKSGETLFIPKGQSLWVETISTVEKNHCLVKLNFQGWKQGYVFGPDWKMPTGQSLGLVGTMAPQKKGLAKIVPSRKEYVLQPDASTCQSASIAMVTGGDVWAIRDALTEGGQVAGDPTVMGNYLRERVKEYKLKFDASLNDIRAAIDDNWELIVHTWLSGSGHVIKISGYEPDPKTLGIKFIVDDPWSGHGADVGRGWTYAPYDLSGDNIRYSPYCMYAACIAGQSADDASNIYSQGILNSSEGGAWLHYCKV